MTRPPDPAPAPAATILVVDDQPANRRLSRAQLEAEGYAVLEAGDGVEALAVLARGRVDAVMSDIFMPNMDGFRLCRRIREDAGLRRTPVMLLTSTFTTVADEELARELGVAEFLRRPAGGREITAAVRRLLATPSRDLPSPVAADAELRARDRVIQKLEHYNHALTRALDPVAWSADPRLVVLFARLSRLAAIATCAIGVIVLAAWLLELPRFTSLIEGQVTMKANTALAFVLAGAALLLVQLPVFATGAGRATAAALAVAVGLLGALSLAESLSGWDLGIDQLLAQDPPEAPGTAAPGRMAMITAVNFVLVAAGLLLVEAEVAGRWRPTQFLAVAIFAVAFVPALGHAYAVDSFLGLPADTRMALPTALAFIVLSLGLMAARPDRGFVALCASGGPGGRMVRRLLPVTVVLPAAVGGLRLAGQQAGLYGTEFGIMLFVAAVTVALVFMICRYSVTLERADQQQRRTDLQMRELIENAPDAMLMVDEHGVIQLVNAEAEFLFGYPRHELVGAAVERLVPEASRAGHVGLRDAFMRAPARRALGAGRELSGQRKDGSLVPIEITVSRVDAGPGTWFMATVRDASARRRAEAEVRREKQFAEQLINSMPGIFYLMDRNARFRRWNARFREVTGYADEEIAELSPLDLFAGADRELIGQRIQAVFAEGQADLEAHLVSRDGARTPYYFTGLRVEVAGQACLVGVGMDITARKRAEDEVRALNAGLEVRVRARTAELEAANKDLEEFSYSVSHDLRAPLRAIDNFSAFVLQDHAGQLDAEGRRLLGVIRRNAADMSRLIDDVLAFSRAGKVEVAAVTVDMTALAVEVRAELTAGGAPGAACDIGELPPAHGDPRMLRQVLANLLGNALKFAGGRDDAEVRVRGRVEDGMAVYEVSDNGVGFDGRFAHKLFGVFQRLHHVEDFPGTGIGLAIVKRIVTRHGGRVWAESHQGRPGATFGFSVPAAPDPHSRGAHGAPYAHANDPAVARPMAERPVGRPMAAVPTKETP